MKLSIIPNSFVVVSDFDDISYSLDKVKNNYINEYDKIFILGDAIDRRDNKSGKDGILLLENIKKLCEKYPDRVMYLPGNYDIFLYEYAKFKNNSSLSFLKQFDLIKGIDNLREKDSDRLNSLMMWLENLPLQRVHFYNDQKFVLAYAFFNQSLYEKNPNYSLKTMYELNKDNEKDRKLYDDLYNVLWFKSNDFYNSKDVPAEAIEIIGHKPAFSMHGNSLDLYNSSGKITKVVCTDGGALFDYEILKQDDVIGTYNDYSVDIFPNITSEQDDFKILINAIVMTASKQGVQNTRNILIHILDNEPLWYQYFPRGNREKIENIGIDNVIKFIKEYANSFENSSVTVNLFLKRLYEDDARFKAVVDSFGESLEDVASNEKKLEDDYSSKSAKHFKKIISNDTNEDESLKEDIFGDSLLLYNDGKLVIIGDIDSNKIEDAALYLVHEYGEDVLDNLSIFDFEVINSQIDYGKIFKLGDTEYTVSKDETGLINIYDSLGNVVYVFSSLMTSMVSSNSSMSIK